MTKDLNPLYQFQIKRWEKTRKPDPCDLIRFKIILSLVGKGNKVLELGCYFPSFTKELISQGNKVVGLDISLVVVKRAKKEGIEAFVCNVESDIWPVKENFFDVVVAAEIIEHLLDTDKFLEKIYQVLKPGGYLILTTPNLASLGRRFLLLIGRNPVIEPSFRLERSGHVRYFVKESLFILLKEHRFKVEEFTSNMILFDQRQIFYSTFLAKIFPTFGKSLIVKARKAEK